MNLGAILHLNGKLQEAEANYLRALELKPDDTITQSNLRKLWNIMEKQGLRTLAPWLWMALTVEHLRWSLKWYVLTGEVIQSKEALKTLFTSLDSQRHESTHVWYNGELLERSRTAEDICSASLTGVLNLKWPIDTYLKCHDRIDFY